MPVPLAKLCPSADAIASDADLLHRFITDRDEAAFTELVRRHGPLVYRVCRRLAPDVADDAFQAAFLALACRAGSIRTPGALAGWLVGVAGRVARQLRTADRRRAERERAAGRGESIGAPPDTLEHADLAAALDDELSRLPDELRAPVVLCLVRGRTHAQAANELGGSIRTLRRRLERGRAVLRVRLERRGVVPAVAVTLVAGVGTPVIAVPAALMRKTGSTVFGFLNGEPVPPALVLAKGVSASMVKFKVSVLVATAAAVLVCIEVGWSNEEPPPAPAVLFPPPMNAAPKQPPAAPPVHVNPTDPLVDNGSATVRGTNFIVHAPTPMMARVIASEAEHHRRAVALKWLGRELPAWPRPVVIQFTQSIGNIGGSSTFTFGKNKAGEPTLASGEMILRGDFLRTLTATLPHEVTHTVLASHFARALPRWADEGIALLSEDDTEQANHDVRVRELLNAGRGVRLKVLLPLTEYPKDVIVLYAQGHSLARFLVNHSGPSGVPMLKELPHVGKLFEAPEADGHRRLIAFVQLGVRENTTESWGKAAKDIYGFKSLDEMEDVWLAWLAKPENVLRPKTITPTPPKEKPSGDAIPPTRLPTASGPNVPAAPGFGR